MIPIVTGNWKMHLTLDEAAAFARMLIPALAPWDGVEQVVCPSFICIPAVHDVLAGTPIKVGAQNVHWKKNGAFTGSISPLMLQGLVEYVILGHSEVRKYLHENDAIINKKVRTALDYGLKPIIAVGESLEQNESGQAETIISGQVSAALSGVNEAVLSSIVIAYEPIWAIGTGRSATSAQANAIIAGAIRGTLAALYGSENAQSVRIQYGGSVKPDNMLDFMSQPDINGALVGGASLKVNDFATLVRLAQEAKGSRTCTG